MDINSLPWNMFKFIEHDKEPNLWEDDDHMYSYDYLWQMISRNHQKAADGEVNEVDVQMRNVGDYLPGESGTVITMDCRDLFFSDINCMIQAAKD